MFWSVTLWSVTLWSVTAEKRRRLKQTGFGHVNGAFMSSPSQRTYAHGPNQPLTLAFDKKLTSDFDKELRGDARVTTAQIGGIWLALNVFVLNVALLQHF